MIVDTHSTVWYDIHRGEMMNIDEWKSQIRRGSLELCILSLINHKDLYGYELISTLDKWPIIATKESTIYPLLRRLLKDEYLTSYWEETQEGLPPRKYYKITSKGKEYLSLMSEEWDNLQRAISEVKEGEVNA